MQTLKITTKKSSGDDKVPAKELRNYNLFVVILTWKKVDWNMKCEKYDNLWVIRNCLSAGQQKLLVIFTFYVRWWKPIENWIEAGKNGSLSVFCFRTHPSVPVWAEIWTRQHFGVGRLEVVVISVDNCCLVWCFDSHLGHCWDLTYNGNM